jgi:glutaredoxin
MITIYGNDKCTWCKKSKSIAEQYNLKYEYLNIDNKSVLEDLRKRLPEVKTIPQIWWSDRYIGGYHEFLIAIHNYINESKEQKI